WQVEKYASALEAGREDVLNRPLNAVIGEGDTLVLIDGFYFYHAYRLAKIDSIAYVKVWGGARAMSGDEVKLLDFGINGIKGLSLRIEDQKERLRLYVNVGRHLTKHIRFKSFGAIAKDLALPRSSVHAWLHKEQPALAAQIAAHNKTDWQQSNRRKEGIRAMK